MRTLHKLLALTLILTFSMSGFSADMTAREIMQKVKDREDGNNSVSDMEMVLVDKHGNKRVRKLRSFRRDAPGNPDDSQSIMFFLEPADVKDTGFLTYDYDDTEKDDDQWLYLPALKKVKRIAASDKSSSFMGSDFTYADMSSPSLEHYKYELLKEGEVNGHKVWQIKSTPITEEEKERTGYTQSVVFVRQDNFVVIRAVNWVKKGSKLKYMDIKKLEKIDGIWTTLEVTMTTKNGQQFEHMSIISSDNYQYNQELDDELFTQRRLSRGL